MVFHLFHFYIHTRLPLTFIPRWWILKKGKARKHMAKTSAVYYGHAEHFLIISSRNYSKGRGVGLKWTFWKNYMFNYVINRYYHANQNKYYISYYYVSQQLFLWHTHQNKLLVAWNGNRWMERVWETLTMEFLTRERLFYYRQPLLTV